jgi:autotransporter-associated beta strand protein
MNMIRCLNLPLAITIFLLGLFSSSVSHAQTNAYWDVNGTANGQGGSGTFSSSGVFWTTNSDNATANSGGPTGGGLFAVGNGASTSTATYTNNGGTWTSNSGAYNFNFGGTAGTVNQGGNYQAYGVNFLSSGYVWTIDGSGTNGRTITTTNAVSLGANSLTLANGARGVNSFTFAGPTSSTGLGITGASGSTLTLRNLTADSATNSFGVYLSGGGTITNAISITTDIAAANKIFLGSQSSGGATIGSAITHEAGTLYFTNSSSVNVTLNGAITGAGKVGAASSGSGNILFNASNSYTGGTTIAGSGTGYVGISNSAAFGSGTVTISGAGTNYVRAMDTALEITNAVTISTGSTLRLATAASGWTETLSGTISGDGGIFYSFTDTQRLTGTNNSFGGGVNIASGLTLQATTIGMAGGNSSLGQNGTVIFSSTSGSGAAGTLAWMGTISETSDKAIALTTVSSSANSGLKIYAGANNAGGTNVTLTLDGNLNSTGYSQAVVTTTNVVGGVTNITSVTNKQNMTISLGAYNTNTLVMNGTINEATGYTNAVVIDGATSGTVKLAGNNTYSGSTTVNSGTLKLGSSTALGSTAGVTSVGSGGFLDLNGQTGVAEALNYTGTGGLVNSAAGTTASVSGVVDIGSATTVQTTGNITLDGKLTGTASKNLTKSGEGTLKVTAADSTFSGTNTVSAGTLMVDTGASIATSTSIVNGGFLKVNGSAGVVTINSGGGLSGSGTVGALTLNSAGALNPGNSPGTLSAASAIVLGGSTYNWQISNLAGTSSCLSVRESCRFLSFSF